MANQKQSQPRAETDPEVLARFEVRDSRVIRTTLRDLSHSPGVICLVASRPIRTWVVTRLLAVDVGHLEFELKTDEHRQSAIIDASELHLIAEFDRVKVQFVVTGAKMMVGADAMRVDMPALIYRIQRRDGYRIRPQAPTRVICNVRDGQGGYSPWQVLDLSVIGLALRVPDGVQAPKPGDRLEHTTIEPAPHELIPASLVVRRSWPIGEDTARGVVIGCEFVHMDAVAERRLQVVITDIERRYRS